MKLLLRFAMHSMLAAGGTRAVLLQFEASLLFGTILGSGIVPPPAIRTCHRYYDASFFFCHGVFILL